MILSYTAFPVGTSVGKEKIIFIDQLGLNKLFKITRNPVSDLIPAASTLQVELVQGVLVLFFSTSAFSWHPHWDFQQEKWSTLGSS